MKEILALILFTALLSSCNNENVTISKSEHNALKGIDSSYPKPYSFQRGRAGSSLSWVVILDQNGHEYLENDGYDAYAIMHSPDCALCLKRIDGKIDKKINLLKTK